MKNQQKKILKINRKQEIVEGDDKKASSVKFIFTRRKRRKGGVICKKEHQVRHEYQ